MQLKPCPFCGKEPLKYSTENPLSGTGVIHVTCCASISEVYILPEYKPDKKDSQRTAEILITKQWNTRKTC